MKISKKSESSQNGIDSTKQFNNCKDSVKRKPVDKNIYDSIFNSNDIIKTEPVQQNYLQFPERHQTIRFFVYKQF